MTTLEASPVTIRLLSGITDPADRLDLNGHEAVHGSLRLPGRRDAGWSNRFIAALDESGLTGRGGAGFPTAQKLQTIRAQRRRPVVVVNAMEGEPASGKDHFLATRVPHLVLDGAALMARSLDASAVQICVARGSRVAARSFAAAVAERARAGMREAPFEVVQPPARYVAGEESALANWLDGGESLPLFRPDRPAFPRVSGRPALVDNAETLAQVALIARYGPEWFRGVGTQEAPGTTLVTVSGAVRAPGIVEVALGTPVWSVLAMAGVVERPAGVLLGGYGGTWLAGADVATPYDPASLGAVGCTTGVGVMVALPTDGCGLAETARIARWMAGESAGQCGPCVFGLPTVADDLSLLAYGRTRRRDIDRLWARLGTIDGRGACRHPDGVVRLVKSAISAFAADLDHHLHHGPCRGANQQSVLAFPPVGEVVEWR
jgi:NADH:ubiquinone oxidoreductase subunit F (NADH-binding)